MLGTVGFIIASIVFILYGHSSYILASKVKNFDKDNYLIAYFLASFACIIWAISANLSGPGMEMGVLIGDVFLILAVTALLATITKSANKTVVMATGLIFALISIIIRLTSAESPPVLQDNVLVFNTPKIFGVFLILLSFFVWLKANMNFYAQVIKPKIANLLRPQYYLANMTAFIGIASFVMARKTLTIIFAFSILVFSFILLTLFNVYINSKIKAKKHDK